METSIRIIDYHLKECIEGQNSKITLSGRSSQQYFCQWYKGVVFYDFKDLSRMRISIPFTRSKILLLVRKTVAP
jgi:hypothetical protein